MPATTINQTKTQFHRLFISPFPFSLSFSLPLSFYRSLSLSLSLPFSLTQNHRGLAHKNNCLLIIYWAWHYNAVVVLRVTTRPDYRYVWGDVKPSDKTQPQLRNTQIIPDLSQNYPKTGKILRSRSSKGCDTTKLPTTTNRSLPQALQLGIFHISDYWTEKSLNYGLRLQIQFTLMLHVWEDIRLIISMRKSSSTPYQIW